MSSLPKIDIRQTFGEAYIGVVLASVFYGITLLQTYTYFDQNSDTWRLKSLVLLVWGLDTFHLGLLIHSTWFYLVENYANPVALPNVVWTLGAMIIVSTAIAILVQGFFALRVWRLSRKMILVVAIMAFGFVHNAFDIFFVVRLLKDGQFHAIPGLTWSTSVSLAGSIVSDIVICVALCYYLWTSRTGFSRTDSLINSLIVYAVSTGLLTTVFSLITLILFAVSRTFLSQTFYYSIAKFYTNSILASLNSREHLRNLRGKESDSIHLSKLRVSGNHNTTRYGTTGNVSMTEDVKSPSLQVNVSRSITHDASLEMNGRSKGQWRQDGSNTRGKPLPDDSWA